ncbi:MAG: hypothetical protein ABJA37_02995 [Ferruginibacter sp.]
MRYCKCLIFIILFFPAKIFAQQDASPATDITGLWKGTLYNDTTKQFYRYEIAISEEKGKLTGFSHTWFILDDKQYYGVKKVKIKRVDDKIIIEDAGLIANNYPVTPAKGVHQLNVLDLNTADSIMTLTGPFTTNRTKEYSALTGTIDLKRKNDYWQSALVPHLEELGLVKELSFVKDDIILRRNDQLITPLVNPVVKTNTYAVTKPAAVIVNNQPIKKTVTENKALSAKTDTGLVGTTSPENKKEITKAANPIPANKPATAIINQPIPKRLEEKQIPLPTKTVTDSTTEKKKQAAIVVKTEPKIPVADLPVNFSKINEPAAELKSRTTMLQQTVYFKADSLQLSLYDNGEVDGDTVSVLMNGNIIMPRVGLSTNAIRKTIFIDEHVDSVQLLMYAENLGSIPPNTGLLVVRDGKDIYEIRFSGDLQKNASIIFRRKKE